MSPIEWLILGGIILGSLSIAVILFRIFANTEWAKRRQDAFRRLARDLHGDYRQTLVARLPEVSAPLKTGRVRVEIVTHQNRMPKTMIAFEEFTVDTKGLEEKIASVLGVASNNVDVTSSSNTLSILIDGVLADRDDFVSVVKEVIGLLKAT